MARTFLVSDASINSYRCRVFLAGSDLSAFESNPIMLYMHERGRVIGKWANLKWEGDKLFADPVFNLKDLKPQGGADIAQQVDDGFLNAASLGIIILEAVYNAELDCYDITKWRLQEISIVDLGSNANALQLYDKAGEPIDQLNLADHLQQFRAPVPAPIPPANPTVSTNSIFMDNKVLALQLGLPDTATDAEITAKLTTFSTANNELETLRKTVADNQKREATELLNLAETEKRLTPAQKPAWEALFAANHENAKAALATLPKPTNLTTFAQGGSAAQAEAGTLTKEEKKKKYKEMDRAGTLGKFKAENPESFADFFEATFGKKPDKMA